ncbi:MAG: hypothetical protein GKS06_09980 [Acidobacteria bacterium]|nr:hypothetical protein [Acidobacteriota bacterium]
MKQQLRSARVAIIAAACACSLVALWPSSAVGSRPEMSPVRPVAMVEPEPLSSGVGVIDTWIHDVDGTIHRLGVGPHYQAVALVFLDPGCPISRRYAPDLADMALRPTGEVRIYGVVSDPTLTASEVRAFGEEYAPGLPLLWDGSGDLALRLAPEMVPEAFVIGADDRVIYRGRIDNRFVSPGRLRGRITETDLRDAIVAVESGIAREPGRTQPVGCFFEAWAGHDLAAVTYERDIAPLLAANCAECHTAGGVGPFELDTYESARRRAGMMAWTASERIMPPWKAREGFGHFRGARMLSDRQIAVLASWAESDKLRGNPADRLPHKKPASSSRWRLGDPDLQIDMPAHFEVPAAGDDIYRYFVVPGGMARGGLIRGIDFQPGDPSVVHHAILYVDYSGTARQLDAADPGVGFSAFGGDGLMGVADAVAIGGWAPGADPYALPDGLALEVPAGADFVFEIHYHLTGRATRDRSTAAIYLSPPEQVDRTVDALYLATEAIDIPAGEAEYARHLSMNIPADIDLIDISPHMHYLGRSARVVATLPDGTQVPLIDIPDWDFRWQNVYVYRRPVRLPAGSRIDAWYRFDNSAENGANPSSPPRDVSYGLQSTDEMCELYITYAAVDPADVPALERANAAALMFGTSEAGNSPPVATRADDPLETLETLGLWHPTAEALLMSLDEASFASLIDRAEHEAQQEDTAGAHALVGGLRLTALFLALDEDSQVDLFMAANSALERALELDAHHWDARMSQAILYLVTEEPRYVRAAIRSLEPLLEGQTGLDPRPGFAKTYVYLGEAYAMLGRDEDAARLWSRGVDAYPDDVELRERSERLQR